MTTSLATGPAPAAIPDFPEPRSARCPFDPSPQMRGLAALGPVLRVRTWDGRTPWVVTSHAEQKALHSDHRLSVDFAAPDFPSPVAHHGGDGHADGEDSHGATDLSFVGMDDPRARPAAPDGQRRLHHQTGRGHAPRRAGDGRRLHRPPARRAQAGRPGPGVLAANPVAGDLRTARSAVRRPRVLPGQQQDPGLPHRHPPPNGTPRTPPWPSTWTGWSARNPPIRPRTCSPGSPRSSRPVS